MKPRESAPAEKGSFLDTEPSSSSSSSSLDTEPPCSSSPCQEQDPDEDRSADGEEDDLGLADKFGRAVGRTAASNLALLCAGPVGAFLTGGAFTVHRAKKALDEDDQKELVKSGSVFTAATTASA